MVLGSQQDPSLTALGLGEAAVQAEDHLLHEVLDLALLRATHKHHPVVHEALSRWLLAQLGMVAELELHLDSALGGERGAYWSGAGWSVGWSIQRSDTHTGSH